jgi:DNA-binding IclR family transcriptional regulator
MSSIVEGRRKKPPLAATGEIEEATTVRSVHRAMGLLRVLLDSPAATASLTELAEASGLATSTVQRLLVTLTKEAVLSRGEDGRYGLGDLMIRAGMTALERVDLFDLVQPHLDRLSAFTRETSHFAILDERGKSLYLRQSLSPNTLRFAPWIGRTISTSSTAIGAALNGRLKAEGYSATRNTLEPDVTAIAAPIYGKTGVIVGAINVVGPTVRISDDDIEKFARAVVGEARAFTTSIGGRWPHQPFSQTQGPAE